MVVIRLSRTGTNKRPFYYVVVADSRFSRDGRYLERIGFYNPIAQGPEVYLRIDQARVSYWQSQGAQATDRVRDLIEEFTQTGEITGAEFNAKNAGKLSNKAKIRAAKKAKTASEAQTAAEQPAA